MKVPLSWLKDFVDIDVPILQLARIMTMVGLEVEEIQLVGLAVDEPAVKTQDAQQEFAVTGLSWDADKIVVAQIDEVMPHPNADRLVLCRLKDGQQEHVVLTGAPNLFDYKGKGPLPQPDQGGLRQRGRPHLRRPPARAGAHHAQTRQNPRGGVLLDGLLGERAGHLRRARGHHHPGRGRPHRDAPGRVHGRRRLRGEDPAQHDPRRQHAGHRARDRGGHAQAAAQAAGELPGQRRADRGQGQHPDHRPRAQPALRRSG